MILPLNSRLLAADVNSSSFSSNDPTTRTQDLVVILAALFCALICVLGLIAVVRCAWIRRLPQTSPPASATASISSAKDKGLNKKVLNSLPKLTYSPFHHQHQHNHHHDHGDDEEEEEERTGSGGQFSVDCAICLAEFVSGEEIRLLPQCRHVFHVGCIDEWLKSHSSCPSCRVQILQQQQQQSQV